MSTRHLVTRAREHLQLNSNSAKSAISQHISSCQTCQNSNLDVSSLKVIRNCHNEYETKHTESIIDKKANTTIEFTIIRQRLLFSFECVLNIFSSVCVCVSNCIHCTKYSIVISWCCFIYLFIFYFFQLDFTMEKV